MFFFFFFLQRETNSKENAQKLNVIINIEITTYFEAVELW